MKVFGVLLTLALAAVALETAQTQQDELDPVSHQLLIFKNQTEDPVCTLTTSAGAPVTYDQASNTLNKKMLNNDFFIEKMSHLISERTPERAVHALGAGAFGYFKVTHDISHICKADFLKKIGKKTPIAVRFSTSSGSIGSSECKLDTRGFSVKMYTHEGNFDIAGFNTPVFSFKEPMHAHAIIHGGRANPATGVPDPTMKWDMLSRIPETLHMMMYVLAGSGIPASYRQMPGWPIHTYQVVNKKGETHFIRFKFDPQAGTKYLKAEEAEKMCAKESRFLTKELYGAIGNGEFPKWDVYVQILTTKDVDKEGSRVFDPTRILPENLYPCKKIGEIVLNRNPTNYYAEVESLAFCPCHVVPGILGAPDSIYRARRLIYRQAQFYRLGKNVNSIGVNCPFQVKAVHTYNRDGAPPFGNNGGAAPNYYPNSFNGPEPCRENASTALIDIIEHKADNFDQAGHLYGHMLTAEERTTLVENLLSILKTVAPIVRDRLVKIFTDIHRDLGSRLKKGLNSTE